LYKVKRFVMINAILRELLRFIIEIIISLGINVKVGLSAIISDTTKLQAIYCKDIRLFDIITGKFYFRVLNNYNYYYFPPISSRFYERIS
jgi:hypothetical protein